MAGYLISLGSAGTLEDVLSSGVYGTLLTEPQGRWQLHHEATLADFVTMRPGDGIYFFAKRKVYGIGELVEVSGSVAHGNSEAWHLPAPIDDPSTLVLEGSDTNSRGRLRRIRFFCCFEPGPHHFRDGIDMDDLLATAPASFRSLRVFWGRSFIKLDDQEDQAFRNALLKRAYLDYGSLEAAPSFESDAVHEGVADALTPEHELRAASLASHCASGQKLSHEMALEATLLDQLSRGVPETVEALGPWDYLSHQVPASPFKPPDYMDFIDIFGAAFVPGHSPTLGRYLVCELKAGSADADEVRQVLKYVDWVRDEYAAGDLSMVRAFLIAYTFTDAAREVAATEVLRRYTLGRRPPRVEEWQDLTLLTYRFDEAAQLVRLHPQEADPQ